ncbi:hypothetical protein F8388_008108 [Cannabis sativa]|uniref:Uncharacterized protein n=1 Tax=Cannabis sativa TaxID=3483 RepID=A0A7J6EUX0_CANSA|nr:hypothetical protein F8388_008108 [Cannabis sativa]
METTLSRKLAPAFGSFASSKIQRLGQKTWTFNVPRSRTSSNHSSFITRKVHDNALASRPDTLATRNLSYDGTDITFAPHGQYWKEVIKNSGKNHQVTYRSRQGDQVSPKKSKEEEKFVDVLLRFHESEDPNKFTLTKDNLKVPEGREILDPWMFLPHELGYHKWHSHENTQSHPQGEEGADNFLKTMWNIQSLVHIYLYIYPPPKSSKTNKRGCKLLVKKQHKPKENDKRQDK